MKGPFVTAGSSADVKALYEVFPYPSPSTGEGLIEDVATGLKLLYGDDPLDGKLILDAGCGTGHRLLAVARAYPRAQCVGVDLASASLATAQRLASAHGLRHVRFEQANVTDLPRDRRFDIIISTGVIHHLEDPLRGLQVLSALLADEGLMSVWLYHAIGEHQRLLDRELLLTMWRRSSGFDQGVRTLKDLSLELETTRYGLKAGPQPRDPSPLHLKADAYLHPIVHAYRFEEAIDLFRACDDIDWVAVNSISMPSGSKLIDVTESETSEARFFCQSIADLFETDRLRSLVRCLDPIERLRVIELKLAPNGFAMLAGRGESFRRFGARIAGNAIVTHPVRS